MTIQATRITTGVISTNEAWLTDSELETIIAQWKDENECVASAHLLDNSVIHYSFLWWATDELMTEAENQLIKYIK
jgi:hypothetical protein